MADRTDLVVDRDPTLPLVTIAESTTETDFEQWQLLLERAALRRQHDSRAQMNGADARLLRDQRRGFPLLAEIAEKIVTRRRQLVESLVAAIAVPAHGGAGQEHR